MLHFVTSYMKQNKSRKQTLESAQYGMEISLNYLLNCVQLKILSHNLSIVFTKSARSKNPWYDSVLSISREIETLNQVAGHLFEPDTHGFHGFPDVTLGYIPANSSYTLR